MLATSDVQAFRRTLVGLTDLTVEDLQLLWAAWPWKEPRALTELAVAAIPDVVVTYANTASGLAADQYNAWRASERVKGRYRATAADVAAWDQIVAGVRNGVSPLWAAVPDVSSAQSLLAGMVIRHVMHGANDTIIQSVQRDPEAVGWARYARSDGCGFCRMLADRGAVYRKRETSSFRSHDRCRCNTGPSWDKDAIIPVDAQYRASRRRPSPADRARTREYIAEHYPDS